MPVRALIAGGLALLVAVQVVRDAAVRSFAESRPATAARFWAGHADVQISQGMIAIATAAREGRRVEASVVDSVYAAGMKAPLAPEPFLVRGVQAQLSGNENLAERAFLQARWRDGRSLPAHYFLAEHYLNRRDAEKGLTEIAALSRLVRGGVSQLAPYVAQYAVVPANARQLQALFRREPELEDSSLAVLASDPRNADLVLRLATRERRNMKNGWAALLLERLIQDRQYGRARSIWAELSDVQRKPGELIFDPQFVRGEAPPPFNWSLASSTVGLSERQRGGGLHVIYYGQQEGTLASQLLMLAPGTYRFATNSAAGRNAGSLSWTLFCGPTNGPIASIGLGQAISQGWRFAVPASCPAQRLELRGSLSDSPQQIDLTIQSVTLSRERDGG
jgi:hypothetical protein